MLESLFDTSIYYIYVRGVNGTKKYRYKSGTFRVFS